MIGTVVSHYKILSQLGAGGMGLVYKAEDVRLNRLVALKFIPPGLTHDPVLKARFIREARAGSSLDHPNICTIHAIEETDEGQLFMVMAYYEGETLASRLHREILSISESLDVEMQLLSGLACAHEHGVVHRDIKPANIMLTRNSVRILDFGLVKPSDDTLLTRPGAVVGTIEYMAPEQALSEAVDHRADLWSAGIVQYEMLTGATPFRKSRPGLTYDAILYEDFEPVTALRPEAPNGIDDIVRRALAKDKDRRYQSADDFLRDLQDITVQEENATRIIATSSPSSISSGRRHGAVRSVLVLPFNNLYDDREGEYFSQGLTDEIITDLSQIHSLRVMSRASSARVKAAKEDQKTLLRRLDVRYVLDGSVRRMGNRLRITANLLDTVTDSVIWADKFSGVLDDIFAIQESLSQEIVGALKVKLTISEERVLKERPIPDVRAYEYYLKAKYEILNYSKDALDRAHEYLQSGLKLVGENELILACLGQLYWQYVNAGHSRDMFYLEKAEDCVRRMRELNPESYHADRLQGMLHLLRGNQVEALRFLKRALKASPNDTDTLCYFCALCSVVGKPEAAAEPAKRLVELDPLIAIYQTAPGLVQRGMGNFAAALLPFLEGLHMDPDDLSLRHAYAQNLAMADRVQESAQEFQTLADRFPTSPFGDLALMYIAAFQGDRAALQSRAERVEAALGNDPEWCWCLSQVYSQAGDTDASIRWLEKSVRLGFINYPLLSQFDPLLKNVRGHARFAPLMQQVKSAWESFEV